MGFGFRVLSLVCGQNLKPIKVFAWGLVVETICPWVGSRADGGVPGCGRGARRGRPTPLFSDLSFTLTDPPKTGCHGTSDV